MRKVSPFIVCVSSVAALIVAALSAEQQSQPLPPLPPLVRVRPIAPPSTSFPPEASTVGITKFSFVVYGDTRCDCRLDNTDNRVGLPAQPEVQRAHALVVDTMLAKIKSLAGTAYPVRFVVQSGDAVFAGVEGARWNDAFTPIIERLTSAGLPYFFAAGNHDVTQTPLGETYHSLGLHNTLSAISKLIPPEGSSRRMSGYPTYGFGFGNTFFITFDSNLAADAAQLAWVTDQLEHLDRARFRHVIVVVHHPPFTSGRYSGFSSTALLANGQTAAAGFVGPQALAIRALYMPLFRKHHVRMILAGHDHLYDHWIERYVDGGVTHRIDQIVSGGGGAPTYVYTGEPDLESYVAAGATQKVRMEHMARPGKTADTNPHHFVVIRVDGDRLSLEVVASQGAAFKPYKGHATIELNDRES